MWEKLRRFNSLETDARGLFLRSALLLPLISLSLWIRGFRFTRDLLQRLCFGLPRLGNLSLSDSALREARKTLTARMVRAAARHSPSKVTCLEESLALWFLLRREGIDTYVQIGARKTAGKFEAHAWVECEGKALNEMEGVHRHYAVFGGVIASVAEAR